MLWTMELNIAVTSYLVQEDKQDISSIHASDYNPPPPPPPLAFLTFDHWMMNIGNKRPIVVTMGTIEQWITPNSWIFLELPVITKCSVIVKNLYEG